MKLEGISAEIRPRNAWESIDLGWALTRRHYGTILRAWLVTVVPLWGLILGVMHQNPFWAMVVIWWLKPVFERVPLFVLSRALFGAPLRLGELWKSWPGMIVRRVFYTLLGGRLSPVRSLVAPILELEGLKGGELARRRRAIVLGAGGAAYWMQLVVLLILHTSWIGVLVFAYQMIPPRYQPSLEVMWAERNDLTTVESLGLVWGWIVLYLSCLTLVTPFYVGGGFGLYLNSRTRLEGWDVELAFRRMNNRLSKVTAGTLVIVMLILWSGVPGTVQAQSPDPQNTISEVLDDPDFKIHKTKIYRFKPRERRDRDFKLPNVGVPFLSGWGNALSWIILGAVGAFVIYLIVRAFLDGRDSGLGRAGPRRAPVKTVMGLNVEEEKLPPDLVSEARKLWSQGDHEAATRLLYRGAISWLAGRAGVPIEESDTEVDCLRRVQSENRPEAGYFAALTKVWVLTAYGEEKGSDEEMTSLFEQWPFVSSRERRVEG